MIPSGSFLLLRFPPSAGRSFAPRFLFGSAASAGEKRLVIVSGDDEISLPATLLSTARSIKCNSIVVYEARASCSIGALFSFDFSFRGEKESQTKEQFASVSVV